MNGAAEYEAGIAAIRETWISEREGDESVADWLARTGRRFGGHGATGYRRDADEMVEIAPHVTVARAAAERLGLVARTTLPPPAAVTVKPIVPPKPEREPTATDRRWVRSLLALGAKDAEIAGSTGLTVATVRALRRAECGR